MKERRALIRRFVLVAGLLALVAASATLSYAAGGGLDPSFGSGGKVRTEFEATAGANAVLLQPDGKIVAAGFAGQGFAVARYNASGSLDTSFGSGGRTTTVFTGGDQAFAVALQPGGKIILGGRTGDLHFALARYGADGTLDTTFGSGGKVVTTIGESSGIFALAVQPDGGIIAAGYARAGGDKIALVRYTANGSTDGSFGSGGAVTTQIGSGSMARALLLLADGKIVVGGSAGGTFVVARYEADGSLDQSFGSESPERGWTQSDFASGPDEVRALALQDNGDVVAGGYTGADFALARYNSHGILDTSFGGSGQVTQHIRDNDVINGVAIQPDGRIVVAGVTGFSINRQFVVARYMPDGTLDPSFSVSQPGPGWVTIDFNNTFDQANAVAIQADGRIVVAGQSADNTKGAFALTRHVNDALFGDVRQGDYFYEPVAYLSRLGAIGGYADGTFRPSNNATRGQLAKIVVLALDLDVVTPERATFHDVASGSAFYSYVETAIAGGIVSGYGAGEEREFRPFSNVTRGQLCKIVVSAAGWELANPATPTFRDVSPANPFYREIETAVARGIISGYDAGGEREFRWGNDATRGQISKIIYLAALDAAEVAK